MPRAVRCEEEEIAAAMAGGELRHAGQEGEAVGEAAAVGAPATARAPVRMWCFGCRSMTGPKDLGGSAVCHLQMRTNSAPQQMRADLMKGTSPTSVGIAARAAVAPRASPARCRRR